MIDFNRIIHHKLNTSPYQWAMIDNLFSIADAKELASTFPRDNFKTVAGYDGEKGYEYEARSLVQMGTSMVSQAHYLSQSWQQLAQDLISNEYRSAISQLTGLNLLTVPIEINVFHYGQGSRLGAHVDLKDKIVTHILYFNAVWEMEDGGCLAILRSQDMSDVVSTILPVVGNSSIHDPVHLASVSGIAFGEDGNYYAGNRKTMSIYRYDGTGSDPDLFAGPFTDSPEGLLPVYDLSSKK